MAAPRARVAIPRSVRRRRWLRITSLVALLPALLLSGGLAVGAAPVTYYVDCSAGSDTRSGTSPSLAWRSLSKASQAPLLPGDRLLFKRGCTWNGTLFLKRSGTAIAPITVGAYGTGSLPRIQNGNDQIAIQASYLIIEYLHVRSDPDSLDAGCENARVGMRRGFRFYSGADDNTLRHSLATDLFGGIWIGPGADRNRVHNNVLRDNDMKKEHPDINDTSGATGIAVQGDDNDVAYNEVTGSDVCSNVYGRDGGAIDVFGGQRNRIHHNVARDNHIFSELGDSRTANTVYAYNRVTASIPKAHFMTTRGSSSRWGPVYGTKVYNNSVHLSGSDSWGVHCDSGCGPAVLTLRNNVIWANGTVGWSDAAFDEGQNVYWRAGGAPKVRFPMSSTSRIADPQWVDVGTGNLRLRSASPAVDTATNAAVNLGFVSDLVGTAVPQGAAPDRGAYELAQGSAPPPAPPPSTTIVADAFSRTVSGSWGSAGTGGAYQHEGPSSAFSTDGSEASMVISAAGRGGSALLPVAQARDTDSRFRLRTNKAATGWGQTTYVVARKVSGIGEYRLNVRFAAGGIYLRGVKLVGSGQSVLSAETQAPFAHQAGVSYWVRTSVSGVSPTTLRIKVWPAGQAEPAGWQYSVTDSAPGLQTSGSVGLRTWIGFDTTNAPVRFYFDDWSVTSQ